jgi:hypothetical protein
MRSTTLHLRGSALGLDSAFFPISSENEIKSWKCKTLNRFSAISIKQERQFSFVISSVPLVPTDRGTIQFRGTGKPQLFANVTAMDLYSLDTDA